ncbi:MAG TPA: 2-oxoglutarate and iron-dependent oxygenase domain-containing protein [Caulobacteraceae bacterium]|nr:2-oxoglutarate and iron-dependent oxygenase domain-containing protein [Caulobacteraceae bacterium]
MSDAGLRPISLNLPAADFAAALGASFQRHGFAVVCDHGLDEARIAAALAAAKGFFALPEPQKRQFHVAGGAGQRGYTPFGIETAKGESAHDLKEFWHVGRDLPPGHALRAVMSDNLWPDEPAGFRDATQWLYGALEGLGATVLQAIALHLRLPETWFAPATAQGNSVLRLLHYPPVEGGGPSIRAGAHEDINAITLLLGAEEAGLEILDRDGAWRAIDPPPGAVVVNVGDMLARLTNDVLPSTTHRVVNPQPDRAGVARYSTPFFLHFRPDFLIRTLPGCVTPDRPDRYPEPITAEAFLRQRLEEIRLA